MLTVDVKETAIGMKEKSKEFYKEHKDEIKTAAIVAGVAGGLASGAAFYGYKVGWETGFSQGVVSVEKATKGLAGLGLTKEQFYHEMDKLFGFDWGNKVCRKRLGDKTFNEFGKALDKVMDYTVDSIKSMKR